MSQVKLPVIGVEEMIYNLKLTGFIFIDESAPTSLIQIGIDYEQLAKQVFTHDKSY